MTKDYYKIPRFNGYNLSEVLFTLFENFEYVMTHENKKEKAKMIRYVYAILDGMYENEIITRELYNDLQECTEEIVQEFKKRSTI